MMPIENKRKAEIIKLLRIYSGGKFDTIYALAGSHKGSCRAHIMSELLGYKVPIAKSGINALESLLMKEFGLVQIFSCDTEAREQLAVAVNQ